MNVIKKLLIAIFLIGTLSMIYSVNIEVNATDIENKANDFIAQRKKSGWRK